MVQEPGLSIPHGWIGWIQLALGTPVVLWAGWPFIERGWASLRTRNLNMFTLIALGTLAAWTFSAAAVLAPGSIPADFRGAGGEPPLYFEVAAVILPVERYARPRAPHTSSASTK